MADHRKPKLAVWKFASCDGCQLSLLDCEDEILAVAGAIDIAYFPEATRGVVRGPYDVSLVEGSVTTPHDAERLHAVRRQTRTLITIGACATAGGIQALRNFKDVREFTQAVYARPEFIDTLATSTPIKAHVNVDYELHGCPISKQQLLEVLTAFLNARKPNIPPHSVCVECNRGCYGCFGPMETPNTVSLSRKLAACGMKERDLQRVYSTFNVGEPPFRQESTRHEP